MVILCTIDLETREVSLPAGQVIASYDHNVDVIRFQAEAIPGFSLDTSSIKIAAQGPNKARHDYAVDPSTVAIEEETGYITFDWPIPRGVTEMPIGTFKYGDKGNLIFSVCAEIIDGSTVSKAWHSDDGIITVVAHLEPESGGGEDPEEEATNAQKIAQLQTDVAVINTQVGALANGSPTPVSTVAEMTDESAVYLYTGSETGYTAGNWYFWNGSAWTSGGTYGGAVTDTTLSISGKPADAKAVGDALEEKADSDDVTALDTRVTAVESDFNEVTEEVLLADITPTINRTEEINGLMLSVPSPGALKVYGTATSTRRYLCLNGQDEITTSNATFSKTLDAGKYRIEMGVTGYQTVLGWQYTYSTFASASILVNHNNPTTIIEFTNPVMIGVVFEGGTNYGTSDNPTYITFNAVKLTANDWKIRDEFTTLKNNVYGFIPELNLFKLFASISDGTSNGVTFTWNEDLTECIVNGTSTGTSSNPARNTFYNSSLPFCLKIGCTYVITLTTPDKNVRLRVNFFDSSDTLLLGRNILANKEVTIPEGTAKIAFRLEVVNGATVSNTVVNGIGIYYKNYENTPIRLKVCTYNIGRYNYGHSPSESHPIADLSVITGEMKEFFRTHDFDIIALQEGQSGLNGQSVYVAIYRYLFPNRVLYSDLSTSPYAPSLYSKFKIIESGDGILTGSRPYVWALLNIYGYNVFVMSVHLALTLEDRLASYDEIKEIVSEYNRFIVFGDFNAGNGVEDWNAQPEYDIMIENGWNTANGGYWGQYNTYAGNNVNDVRRLDTIITSKNICITTYDAPYLRDSMPSDHRPLICDLTIS